MERIGWPVEILRSRAGDESRALRVRFDYTMSLKLHNVAQDSNIATRAQMVNPQAQQGQNPRTTRVRQVILDAAVGLLVEHGAGEVTALRIAQETGVARTTIYRHWPEQSHLLLDAIDSVVAPHSPTTITDDLGADLITALSNLRARMTRHPFRQIFAALLGYANQDPAFVAAQQRFVNGVLQPVNDILTDAVNREDLPASVDIGQATAVLAGPLFHQHVMLRESIDDHLITNAVHHSSLPDLETRPR